MTDHSKHLCGPMCGEGQHPIALAGQVDVREQSKQRVFGATLGEIEDAAVKWGEGSFAGKVRDNTLKFAEAMALDPSDVEAEVNGTWRPLLDVEEDFSIRQLRKCKFRRSRPRRSRVEEMADARWVPGTHYCEARDVDRWTREEMVKEVVKFVRETWPVHGVIAPYIERHFLEKR